jgi:hypothetical protein
MVRTLLSKKRTGLRRFSLTKGIKEKLKDRALIKELALNLLSQEFMNSIFLRQAKATGVERGTRWRAFVDQPPTCMSVLAHTPPIHILIHFIQKPNTISELHASIASLGPSNASMASLVTGTQQCLNAFRQPEQAS